MELELLTPALLPDYIQAVGESPLDKLDRVSHGEIPVDYFQFYKAVSTVYSSKIEGEDIDFDSFFKHKFMNVGYKADYTKRADDLFTAYQFIDTAPLNFETVMEAHAVLSASLLPRSELKRIRTNPMLVIGPEDKIEYVATSPSIVQEETEKLFRDITLLLSAELDGYESFYYASLIHLAFVKIHPFQDGNGRTARLMEKWFLIHHLGEKAAGVQLEKHYYHNLKSYYENIKKLGIDYDQLGYSKALDFLLMPPASLDLSTG